MNPEQSVTEGVRSYGPAATIVTAWLLAGTIDITVASIYFPLAGGFKLILLYQNIASGVLGAGAFAGGIWTAALGLVFHYTIAFIWTEFYFLLCRRIHLYSWNRAVTAAAYGILVSCVMTFIVLPLSNVHHYPVKPEHFIISTVILMFTIGLPIATIVGRYYSARHASERSAMPR